MTKLSANRAAKEAGVAKKTLLEAINKGRMSADKNDKGHWEIDPAELFRCFPKQGETAPPEPKATHHQKTTENSPIAVEVATLREQLRSAETEKGYLVQQIEDLRERAERAERKEDEARALLTATAAEAPPKGFWSRITGR